MPQPPFNPYAPPRAHGAPGSFGSTRARAEGRMLVFARDALLPEACVKCGTQQQIGRRRKKYLFVPWYGRLFGLVGHLMTRRVADVDLPICQACDARFKRAKQAMWIASAVPVLGVALLFLGVALDFGPLVGGGFFLFIGGWLVPLLVYAAFAMKRMMPIVTNIDEREIRLARVHPDAIQFYVRDLGGAPEERE